MTAILTLILAVAALLGGSSDLLDFVSSDSYWQIKKGDLTETAMLAELTQPADISKLIEQLSSDDPTQRADARKKIGHLGMAALQPLQKAAQSSDPELASAARELISQVGDQAKTTAVRRLMAIRALGELGDPRALPLLKSLANSPAMFEPDYAAQAIARIEHRDFARPAIPAAQREADAWNLPGFDSAVVQIAFCGGAPTRVESILRFFSIVPRPAADTESQELSRQVIEVAQTVGNVRLDLLTCSVADPLQNGQWNATFVLRGRYDSHALQDLLKKTVPWSKVRDQVYFQDGPIGVVVLGDDRLLINAGMNFNRRIPAIQAVVEQAATLHDSAVLSPLIAAADKSGPIWGVLNVTPAFRAFSARLAPFDSLTLTSRLDAARLRLTLLARGRDAAAIAQDAADCQAAIAKRLAQAPARMLLAADAVAFKVMRSIDVKSAGPAATATCEIPIPIIPP